MDNSAGETQNARLSNELRVFISSTFRDLQEEREHLVKKIFPEVRSLCRERGVTFTDIDLRWGITEEEAERDGIIRICLDEIDRCRPYFIGILGERYGWTPPPSDAERVADDFPVLADALMHGASITEMEIVHGVLSNPAMTGHAFFYFRNHDATPGEFIDGDAESVGRLNDLKDRIRQSGLPVREGFASPAELGAWLEEDLRRVVETEHPESEAPGPLELERRGHRAFAASRRRAYIAIPEYAQHFADWLAEPPLTDPQVPSLPLVILAESGLGKSSLIANLVDEYRRDHSTAFVIEHYVGATQTSGSATSVMRHIVAEIRERFAITDELPARPDDLEKSFPNWLFRAEHYAKQAGIEMLIVIDAVNQLDEAGRRVTWLPRTIPPGIRLLVSTTPGECADHLAQYAWRTLDIAPIDDERTREQIVGRYLGEFRKSITREQTRRLTSDVKGSSPLYLRVVSEELRLHGEHKTLDAVIDSFVGVKDLLDVFDLVLDRLEHDYGAGAVQRLMSMLWASRSGLAELELMELTDLSRVDLSRLLFAVDYHFLQRDGRLGFFHDYLRRAVEKRYLSDLGKKRGAHEQLAAYFEQEPATLRATRELLHALESLGDRERLEMALSQIERFEQLWSVERDEALRLWSATEPSKIAAAYHAGLQRWQATLAEQGRCAALGHIAVLLRTVGAWQEAMSIERGRLVLAEEQGDRAEEASAHDHLGWMLQLRGAYEESLGELALARDLYAELGDRSGLSQAIGNVGSVYLNRGEFEEALECFHQQEAICRELGRGSELAGAIGHVGTVYYHRGEYDQALEHHRQREAIHRDLGDRNGVAGALFNIGVVYADRGEPDQALECYRQVETIWRDLGNRQGVASVMGNIGIVYGSLGEYDKVLECYRQAETMFRDLGDPRGLAAVINNFGMVYSSQGKLNEAMKQFKEALEINRSIGNRYWMAKNLGNIGDLYHRRGQYDQALEYSRQKETICRELDDHAGVAAAIDSIGLVYADLGEYDKALECYRQSEAIYREFGDREGIFIAIGNMGNVFARRGEYDQALECFRQAAEEHRATGFRSDLSLWLWGTAAVLLELVEAGGRQLPEYLARYVPGAEPETWRALSLRVAREHAEECVAICEDIAKLDTLFDGRLLLARITAAEGDVESTLATMRAMLEENRVEDPLLRYIQQAELHYRLWKLNATEGDHRGKALRLYQSLIEKTPMPDYRQRIDELTAAISTGERDATE